MRRCTAFGIFPAFRWCVRTPSCRVSTGPARKKTSTTPPPSAGAASVLPPASAKTTSTTTSSSSLTTAAKAAAAAPAPPTSEDYRALLLDLLLYRQETVAPVLKALQREREELEAQLTQLEAHVRELRQIRDELRLLAEQKVEEEHRTLYASVVDAASLPGRTSAKRRPEPEAQGTATDEVVL